MKILITGSSGYVGYVLSKHFSEKKIKVVGCGLHENPVWDGNKNFKFYNCDVTDRARLEEIFKKEKPTHVIHLAYLMNPIHDVERETEIDVGGSINALELANKTKSVRQLILFSSASAYGSWPDNEIWIKETQELRPRDYRYGINKKKVEEIYNEFKRRKSLKIVIFRMCTAIGPLYQKKGGVVALLANSPFMVKLNGKYYGLQFIHEDDLTALTEKVAKDRKIDGTYNLAPDSYATTRELAHDKFFLWMPAWLMKSIVWILWQLRIIKIRLAAINLSTYGIIIDPKKLMKRYHYKFKYSTLAAFRETVRERKRLETL